MVSEATRCCFLNDSTETFLPKLYHNSYLCYTTSLCMLLDWKQQTEFRHDLRVAPITLTCICMYLQVSESLMYVLSFVVIDTDLGVGLKIMGGVKCDRCLKLHAVVTSVFASSKDHLHTDVKEGKVWRTSEEWLLLVGTPTMITA